MSPRPASRTETCLGRCGLWSLRERVGYKGPTWLVVVLILWCPARGRDRCCRPVGDRVCAAGAVAAGVGLVGGVRGGRSHAGGEGGGRAAGEGFAMAWSRGDWAAMWRVLTPSARAAYPEARFAAVYRSAEKTAGVRSLRIGAVGSEHGGAIAVRVAVRTD